MRLDVAGRSDVGKMRNLNEDRYAIRGDLPSGGTLCVVADGMGGHASGDVAAALAVEHVVEAVEQAADLRAAIGRANAAIFQQAGVAVDSRGMGTTITCALIDGDRARYAHAGDSRIYLVHDGAARQLTADHSWVAEQVRAGRLTAEQARHSSHRNLVTRALGLLPEVQVDEGTCLLDAGDALLLCSDGLHGLVGDEELAAACAQPAAEGSAQLIALANSRGGSDNATVVIARVLDGAAARTRAAVTRPIPDATPDHPLPPSDGAATGQDGSADQPPARAIIPQRRQRRPPEKGDTGVAPTPAWLLAVAALAVVAVAVIVTLIVSGRGV